MPQNDKINVRGVYFDNVTMDEAFRKAVTLIETEGFSYMVTPNSEIVQACVENPALYDVVNTADLTIPDGIGVVYASKILKTPLQQKVAGVDFADGLLGMLAQNGKSVYLLGSKPGIAELAAQKMLEKHPKLHICGMNDGYFKDEAPIIEKINAARPDVLFVCLGVPVQERWTADNKGAFTTVRVCMCLGGSLDVYAGVAQRAPKFFVDHSLEWFYRLVKEPKRIGRMMKLPKFLFGTYLAKFRGKA